MEAHKWIKAAGERLYGPRYHRRLAGALGVSETTVARWSREGWRVRLKHVRRVEQLLRDTAIAIDTLQSQAMVLDGIIDDDDPEC